MISFSLGKMLQTGLVKICLPIILQWETRGLGELLSRKEGSPFLGQLTNVVGEKTDYKLTTFSCKRTEVGLET